MESRTASSANSLCPTWAEAGRPDVARGEAGGEGEVKYILLPFIICLENKVCLCFVFLYVHIATSGTTHGLRAEARDIALIE